MSNFNDKVLKNVAEAASKIMAETSHGSTPKTPKEKSLAALAHPKDKITHKDVLVGRGVLKKEEKEELDEANKMKYDQKKVNHLKYIVDVLEKEKKEFSRLKDSEEVIGIINKAINLFAKEYTKHLNALSAGRGRDTNFRFNEEVEELDEAFPTVADGEKSLRAKEGKTTHGKITKTKTGVKHERDYDDQPEPEVKRGRGRPKKRLSEMRQEYFNYFEEEVDNETFTKEIKDQEAKFAGKKKGADVAKPSVQAVKQEEVEQIDEISKETAGKYLTAPQGKGANKYKVSSDKSVYPNIETMTKHSTNVRRALKRSEGSSLYKKPDYYKEEVEQIDELSKKTLGSYIKKANARQTDDYHDAGSMDVEPERRDGIARTEKIRRAVDKLVSKKTNEEVELDERTLTSDETKKKEDYVMGMKKKMAGFKQRYGERAKSVMYATATKMAKKD